MKKNMGGHRWRGIAVAVWIVWTMPRIAIAQDPGQALVSPILPMAPNAFSLAKFGDVPVSYYTGTPEISIPIYTVRQGSLTVPISLGYHASGIRVTDNASWVGLGWALNAGGSLSRSVRGVADEKSVGFLAIGGRIDSATYLSDPSYLKQASEGLIDTESDVYFISAPGLSAKFAFSAEGKVVLTDYQDIDIKRPKELGSSIFSWRVIGEDGTIYYYGPDDENSFEGKDISDFQDQLSGNTQHYVSAWHLREIVSADKQDTITFHYTTEDIEYVTYSPENIRMPYVDYANPNIYPTCVASPYTYTERSITDVNVNQGLLTRIEFRNGSVEFVASQSERSDLQGSHSLDLIRIKDTGGSIIKYYDLKYGAFAGARADLKLTDVQEFSADGEGMPPHSFTYNESVTLGNKDSFQQDHWGFFNSNPASKMIPKYLTDETGVYVYYKDGGDRDTDKDRTLASILTKIIYPTGGRTEFEFEAHDISLVGNRNATEYFYTDSVAQASCASGDCSAGSIIDGNTFYLTGPTSAKVYMHCTCVDGVQSPDPVSGSVAIWPATGSMSDPLFGAGCGSSNNQEEIEFYTVLQPGSYNLQAMSERSGDSFSSSIIKVTLTGQRTVTNAGSSMVGGARIKSIKEFDHNDALINTKKYDYTYKPTPTSSVKSSGVLIAKPVYYFRTTYQALQPVNFDEHYPVVELITCQDNCGMSTARNSLGDGSHIGYKEVKVSYGENGENGSTIYKYTSGLDYPDVGGLTFPFALQQSRDNRRGKLTDQIDFNSDGDTVKYAHFEFEIDANDKRLPAASLKVGKLGNTIIDPTVSDFRLQFYLNMQEWQHPTKTTEISYLDSERVSTETSYFYDHPGNHTQLTRTETVRSDGSIQRMKFKYPQDYVAADNPHITSLRNAHIFTPVIEQQSWLVRNSVESLLSSKLIDFDPIYFQPSTISIAEVTGDVQSLNNESMVGDSLYVHHVSDTELFHDRATFTYDHGRVKTQMLTSDVKKSYIWGYRYAQPIAEAINAEPGDIAYTSFEDNSDGSWVISSSTRTTSAAYTGKKSYGISGTQTVSRSGLSSSKKYRVMFWANSSGVRVNTQAATASASSGYGWTRYEIVISSATSVSITGSGTIDELRICPVEAQMKTLTFDPFMGVTSVSDENGLPTFYVYDQFGRLSLVKDYQGNILKQTEYHYQTR